MLFQKYPPVQNVHIRQHNYSSAISSPISARQEDSNYLSTLSCYDELPPKGNNLNDNSGESLSSSNNHSISTNIYSTLSQTWSTSHQAQEKRKMLQKRNNKRS